MKFCAMILLLLTISGCNRPDEMDEHSANHPGNADAPQTPPSAQSDTLKITYSKADSFKPTENPKTASPDAKPGGAGTVGEHEGHEAKEKSVPAPEKKPDHSEHQKK
jgi:hypothetical protein